MKSTQVAMSLVSRLTPSLQRVKRHWWVSVFLWLMAISPAMALELRVAIEEGVSQVKVGSSTEAIVRDGSGRVLGELAGMNGFLAQRHGSNIALSQWQANRMFIEPQGDGYVYIGDRWYRGRTALVSTGSGMVAVNYVDLDEYLYSVIGAEMSPSWPMEALKAQAVAARSYALYQRQNVGNGTYDVGDTTAWQAYRGLESEANTTQAAAEATTGEVLSYNGGVIEAVFHSSSGGHTENVEDVWTSPRPYLRGVPDYDRGAPVFQWQETFSRSGLSSRISGVGNIIAMTPERTTPRGRIVTMKVVGDAGTRLLSGDDLRKVLNLRSTLFSVIPHGQKNSAPTGFTIAGRGFGHGVGLSQWGAHNLARKGHNYRQILAHYYRNSSLAKVE
jgi:stage II sporulation protein D